MGTGVPNPALAQDSEAPQEITASPPPAENLLDAQEAEDTNPQQSLQAPNEDIFFDAEDLAPSPPSAQREGVRNVDPVTEPASRFVIVDKDQAAGSISARLVSAQRAMKLGRFDSALRIYNDLYKENAGDPNILLGRAIALQKVGMTEQAISAYEQLLDKRPDNLEARLNMLGLLGGRYPAVALSRLLELEKEYPENVGLLAQIAVMQAKMNLVDEAVENLGLAASLEPQNASHLFNLAVILDRADRTEEAVSYYERALEVDTIFGAGSSIPRDLVFERLAALR